MYKIEQLDGIKTLFQELENYRKKPECKYFQLCGLYNLCCN